MDTIADLLTRIRNALAVKRPDVVAPYSKLKASLAAVLQKQGWVEAVETMDSGNLKFLKLKLKYTDTGEPAITGLKRVSRPGQRIYARATEIPKVRYGFGVTIVSTSRGLMTDHQARKEKLGGEVICQIW